MGVKIRSLCSLSLHLNRKDSEEVTRVGVFVMERKWRVVWTGMERVRLVSCVQRASRGSADGDRGEERGGS